MPRRKKTDTSPSATGAAQAKATAARAGEALIAQKELPYGRLLLAQAGDNLRLDLTLSMQAYPNVCAALMDEDGNNILPSMCFGLRSQQPSGFFSNAELDQKGNMTLQSSAENLGRMIVAMKMVMDELNDEYESKRERERLAALNGAKGSGYSAPGIDPPYPAHRGTREADGEETGPTHEDHSAHPKPPATEPVPPPETVSVPREGNPEPVSAAPDIAAARVKAASMTPEEGAEAIRKAQRLLERRRKNPGIFSGGKPSTTETSDKE
ncbi:hypothetical protein [Acidithiobacillus ferrivorans]|uniref:hypothetical protein n=1 Tax=Acidithiobacillus ferrivorans TaxID=160808 RepID=UPI001C075DA7|nr:hypothetical protein [Acidithiobacillus ferrivorans]MBU2852301.1 hypothetical protein [Acidithiobacillus ferrivorans]